MRLPDDEPDARMAVAIWRLSRSASCLPVVYVERLACRVQRRNRQHGRLDPPDTPGSDVPQALRLVGHHPQGGAL